MKHQYAQFVVEILRDGERETVRFFFVSPKGTKTDYGCDPKQEVVALNRLAAEGWSVVAVTPYTNHRHGGQHYYDYQATPYRVEYLLERGAFGSNEE